MEIIRNSLHPYKSNKDSNFFFANKISSYVDDFQLENSKDKNFSKRVGDFCFKVESLVITSNLVSLTSIEQFTVQSILSKINKVDFFNILFDYYPYSWRLIYTNNELTNSDQLKTCLNALNNILELNNFSLSINWFLLFEFSLRKRYQDSPEIPILYIQQETHSLIANYIVKNLGHLDGHIDTILKLAQMALHDFSFSLIVDLYIHKLFLEKLKKYDFSHLVRPSGRNLLLLILFLPQHEDRLIIYQKYFDLLSINQKNEFFNSLYLLIKSKNAFGPVLAKIGDAEIIEKVVFIYREFYKYIEEPRKNSENTHNTLFLFFKRVKRKISLSDDRLRNLQNLVRDARHGILGEKTGKKVLGLFLERCEKIEELSFYSSFAKLITDDEGLEKSFVKVIKKMARQIDEDKGILEVLLKDWVVRNPKILISRKFLKLADETKIDIKNIL